MPIWLSVMARPLPFSVSRPAIEPTMVTSSPSRIHTVPRPMTTSQCHLAQGNRSIRAGMFVLMLPVWTPLILASRAACCGQERSQRTSHVVPARIRVKHGRTAADPAWAGVCAHGVSLSRRTTTRSCRVEEVCPLLRRVLLSMSRSRRIRHLVETAPGSRSVVARYVPGTTAEDAVEATHTLADKGLLVSLDHLGEDTTDLAQATATKEAYLRLLDLLDRDGLTGGAEVSVKLSAVGQALPGDGEKVALENARAICEVATAAGTTVTLDMEDHTTTDSTLGILRELRQDFPGTGAVLQAYLHRTEADCADLAHAGSRVRLCKGAYKEPESVAFQGKRDVDRAYVRAAKVLMAGHGYPMLATHDPRLVAIGEDLARRYDRAKDSYEFQMLYGVRPHEQERIVATGQRMRVYIPYGDEWYGYLVRRMAEKPANLALFLRSVLTKG